VAPSEYVDMTSTQTHQHDIPFDPTQITRPEPVLLKYYGCIALLTGPVAPITFLPLFFKYHTLRYRFDHSGIAMSWGILFRRETYLTYTRIQDIHLTRNIIQRWMGLATVSIQTASGSATPEMSIEGVLAAEPLRDFLYAKMRGAKGEREPATSIEPRGGAENDEALELLREIRDLLRSLSVQRGGS
jgi:putative membrane protein